MPLSVKRLLSCFSNFVTTALSLSWISFASFLQRLMLLSSWDEQQSRSSEDQEDNEQSDDSEIDDYEEQSFGVLFIPDDAVECVAVR